MEEYSRRVTSPHATPATSSRPNAQGLSARITFNAEMIGGGERVRL